MGPAASETDVKWLEQQIKTVATTAAGISGELSAYKKDLHVISDRVLIIETQRSSEKDKLTDLCDDLDVIDNTLEKELLSLRKDLKALTTKFNALHIHFTLKRILTYTSLGIGSVVALLKLLNTIGIKLTLGG